MVVREPGLSIRQANRLACLLGKPEFGLGHGQRLVPRCNSEGKCWWPSSFMPTAFASLLIPEALPATAGLSAVTETG